jgi:hypothetical protein
VVQRVLANLENAEVDVFVVWIPALPADDYDAAAKSMSLIPDRRARHYWDGSQALGEAFSPVLRIRARMAWDVYLLFDPDARFSGPLPEPRVFLHQIGGEDPERQLSEEKLESAILALTN